MSCLELSADLVIKPLDVKDSETCLRYLGSALVKGGYVKESFIEAVIERERRYPTGLITRSLGVAIPHADAEHVIKPGIAVGVLEKPVKFRVMASEHETVLVDIVLMLAINDPDMQIGVLQRVTDLIQDENILVKMKRLSREQIVEILRHIFS